MGQTVAPTPFAAWLREELGSRDWGLRTLARRINPDEPEVARRALNRFMKGTWPTARYREQIANALEVDEQEIPRQEVAAESGDPFPAGSGSGVARVRRAQSGRTSGSEGRGTSGGQVKGAA